MTKPESALRFALAALLLAAACQKTPDVAVTSEQDAASPAAAPAPAAAQPLAAHAPTGNSEPQAELPPDHPQLDAATRAAMQLPAVPSEAGQGDSALAWETPEGWVAEPPANSMRRAQYRVPGPAGDAECVVFYFGPGQGGAPLENAERWASQFTDAAGQPATGSMKTSSAAVNGVSVLRVEASGTFHQGSMMGAGQVVARPDWALLGAIAEGPDSNWFFKMTGPQPTIEANRAAFETLVASIQRGG